MNIFEIATRKALRFPTSKGALSVEDLWNLPLTHSQGVNLDSMAQFLHTQLQDTAQVSFVTPSATSSKNAELQLKFDVVKHIIDVKLAERDAAELASAKKEKKERLQEILAQKQDQQLMAAGIDEIQKMIEAL